MTPDATIPANIIDAGDVLIVGAGLAGLFTAFKLAPRPVTILMAGKGARGTASRWAQGGIAAALAADDTAENHIRDTIAAGAGLVNKNMARILADEAEDRIADLLRYGVPFDRDSDGEFILGKEAAHSHNRIVRVSGDRAGREIMNVLEQRAKATPSIRFIEGYAAYNLAVEGERIVGVFATQNASAMNTEFEPTSAILIRAKATILATGGCGHLFETTTNPITANGEALGMAARAGATLMDSEFMQFHPTALHGIADPAPLASEALRGEGAQLINGNGERFMPDLHPDAELAPRDIVARAVFAQITETGSVGLDLRGDHLHGLAADLENRFPTIYASCKDAGIDPCTTPLPVAPAAHFHMGGIATNAYGRTSLDGLWACGEVAATGVHGANRLASNSLLETLVFGARIAEDINGTIPNQTREAEATTPPPSPLYGHFETQTNSQSSEAQIVPQVAMKHLRHIMNRYVGVQRDAQGLIYALNELLRLQRAAHASASFTNRILAGLAITYAAWKREESRGGHYRTDYPDMLPHSRHSRLTLTELQNGLARVPQAETHFTKNEISNIRKD
ncbi:MAG: L-aspartate oxidase [Alphaproteobacteria bacterium]|nr:L-aspartate oxidase [Alphaproteobacteria bacterium]